MNEPSHRQAADPARPLAGVLAIVIVLALGAVADLAAAEGDPARGAIVYERCAGCHSLDANRVGPMHRGVYGRRAGTVPGYDYSPALRGSGVVWDEATLDAWLAGPRAFIPGTRMAFRLDNAQDRVDVIAYLRQQSGR